MSEREHAADNTKLGEEIRIAKSKSTTFDCADYALSGRQIEVVRFGHPPLADECDNVARKIGKLLDHKLPH